MEKGLKRINKVLQKIHGTNEISGQDLARIYGGICAMFTSEREGKIRYGNCYLCPFNNTRNFLTPWPGGLLHNKNQPTLFACPNAVPFDVNKPASQRAMRIYFPRLGHTENDNLLSTPLKRRFVILQALRALTPLFHRDDNIREGVQSPLVPQFSVEQVDTQNTLPYFIWKNNCDPRNTNLSLSLKPEQTVSIIPESVKIRA